LLATYVGIFFHYFNRLWRSEKLATSYIYEAEAFRLFESLGYQQP